MGVIVDMGLHVQDFGGFKELPCLGGELLGVTLGDPSQLILLQLLRGEKKWPHMIEILKLKAWEEVRKGLKSNVWFPCLPRLDIL